MDLSTMMTKLNAGQYKNEDELADDARLMVQNCIKYNGETHPIKTLCDRMLEAFECGFSKIRKAKERSNVSIFDKLNQKENEIRTKITSHQELIDSLNTQLNSVIEQRKMEEELRDMSKVAKKKKITKVPTQVAVDENSEEDDTAASMTYDELKYLTQEINKLDQMHIINVIEIIKKYEHNVGDMMEEIEFDADRLKPKTLRELEKFIHKIKKPKPRKSYKENLIALIYL
jgi:hypothetical protein